ncbi:MAG: prepilin-type N-terminal cleavage/methylation domain-containing protein [Elusimicrobiota bacterium]
MMRTMLFRRRGFTLIELMIAIFIFAMVIAGLSVIYSTAYRQGYRILRETRLRNMGLVAMRWIDKDLHAATRLDTPVLGGRNDVLSGFKNYAPTYEPAPNAWTQVAASENVSWFYYCVSDEVPGRCTAGGQHEPRCLWRYSGTGTAAPSIGACGVDSGGMLLASKVEKDEMNNVFSRATGDDVQERNQVRVNFKMIIPALNIQSPMIQHKVDSTFNMEFSQSP